MSVKIKMEKGKQGLFVPKEVADKQKIKIFCPILQYKNRVDPFNDSFYAMLFYTKSQMPNFFPHIKPHSSTNIIEARTWSIKYAQMMGADYLLFVDEDIKVNPDVLVKLINSKKDIVSALIFKRKLITSPAFSIFQKNPDNPTEEMLVPFWDYPKNSLFFVPAAGTGCMLINMKIFKKFPEPYFKFWKGIGEDIFFCLRAREAGIKTWVNSKAKTEHIQMLYRFIGEKVYEEQRKQFEIIEEKHKQKHCAKCACRLCKDVACMFVQCLNCERKTGYKKCPEPSYKTMKEKIKE